MGAYVSESRPDNLFQVHSDLSDFEAGVLAHLSQGLEVSEVADATGSVVKVSSALNRLHTKTETKNLHSLVLWGARHAFCCRWEPVTSSSPARRPREEP